MSVGGVGNFRKGEKKMKLIKSIRTFERIAKYRKYLKFYKNYFVYKKGKNTQTFYYDNERNTNYYMNVECLVFIKYTIKKWYRKEYQTINKGF